MVSELRSSGKMIGIALEEIKPGDDLAEVVMTISPEGIKLVEIRYNDNWAPGPQADRVFKGRAVMAAIRQGLL